MIHILPGHRLLQKLSVLFPFLMLCIGGANAQPFTAMPINEFPEVYYSSVTWVDFNNDDIKDVFISGTDGTGNIYTSLFINNNDSTFTDIAANFASVYSAKTALNDYNNDGYTDFLLMGTNQSGSPVTAVYRNNTNNTVTDINASIEQLNNGDVIWEDLDNDPDAEILICGTNLSGIKKTILYKYTEGAFVEIETGLPDISNGTLEIIDYNNDGLNDLLLTGINSYGTKISDIYKNKGNLSFEKINTVFARVSGSATEVLDFDSDGDSDILIAGFDQFGNSVSNLYSNDGNGIFSLAASFEPVSGCGVACADVNNDGFTDILLSGINDASVSITNLYTNNGDETFTLSPLSFTGVQNGSLAIADYNNDGKNDFFLSGYSSTGPVCNLYSNDILTSNAAPGYPAGLTTISAHDSVVFSWNSTTDDLTASNALGYNIYVGTTSGAGNFLSPESNILNGQSRRTQKGIVGQNTYYKLNNMPEGLYYWSVQSIDNATGYSAFAPEQTFTICHDISLGSDTSLCPFDTLSLQIGEATDGVNWYSQKQGLIATNANQVNFPVIENDKIIVELTNSLGCTLYDTLQVDTLARPVFSLGADTAVCNGDTIGLNAAVPLTEIEWYTSSDGLINNTDTSIYYLSQQNNTIWSRAKNTAGCYFTDSITVNTLALPEINLGEDRDICYADSTLLEAMGYAKVNWMSAFNGASVSTVDSYWHVVTRNDTLIVEVENASNCSNSDTIRINAIDLPVFTVGKDTSVCYGESVRLYPDTQADSMNWYFNRDNISAINTDTLEFESLFRDTIVAEFYALTGCVNYDTIVIDTITLPYAELGNDTSICYGSSMDIEATGIYDSIAWYTGGKYQVSGQETFNHIVLGDYPVHVEIFNTKGCVNYDTIGVSRLELPDFALPADTSICYLDSMMLSMPGTWDTIIWNSTGEGYVTNGGAGFLHLAINDGSVRVKVINNEGCSDIDTIIINVLPLPEINLVKDTTLCYGDWLQLSVDSLSYKVNWYGLSEDTLYFADSPLFKMQVLAPETLRVHVENGHTCTLNDTVAINMNTLPEFSLGADTALCFGDSVSLSVTRPFESILWKRLVSGRTVFGSSDYSYSVTITDTITAYITDTNACGFSDTVIVRKYDLPVYSPGEDVFICQSDSVQIGGDNRGAGYRYTWLPKTGMSSAEASNPYVRPIESTTYIQKITDTNSCFVTDTIYAKVNPKGNADAGIDKSICIYDSVELGGNPTAYGADFPYTYLWQPALAVDNIYSPNPVVRPKETTEYHVVVKSGECLVDTAYVRVAVNPLPDITITEDIKIGLYDEVQLTANGGVEYLWSPGTGLDYPDVADPVASPEESTTYVVSVTSEHGCVNRDSVKVELKSELFIPTLFTPNDDGNNDIFKVYGFGIERVNFRIYNLQGVVVFETADAAVLQEQGWDGTYNGQAVPAGKYFWNMEGLFFNGEPLEFENKNSGIITLLR